MNLGKLKSYRKGGYTFEFVLHDSLDLRLDTYPNLYLTHKQRPILIRDEVDSYHEEDDYNKISFTYQDYVLPQIRSFEVKADYRHERNTPYSVRIMAQDANNLPLLDANIELIIQSKKIKQIFVPYFTIQDTLFYHTQKLDAFGETTITLPDSIFKDLKASFDYNLFVKVTNSNFETKKYSQTIFYDYEIRKLDYQIKISDFISEFDEGKVKAFLLEKGDTIKTEGIVKVYSENKNSVYDSYIERKISFPFEEEVSLTAQKYVFERAANEQITNKKLRTTLTLPSQIDLPIQHTFTKDSLFVTVENDWQHEVYYIFYRGGKKIKEGKTKEKEFYFDVPANYKDRFYLTLSTTQQGKEKSKSQVFRRDKSILKLNISLKNKVIPAQKDTITVSVKNYKNRPVKNTDVTVVATNAQFQQDDTPIAIVPIKYQRYRGLKYKKNYDAIKELQTVNPKSDTLLYFWKHDAKNEWKLDSLPYYNLIYPKKEGSRFVIDNFYTASISRFYPIFYKKGIPLKMYYLKVEDSLVDIKSYEIQTDEKKHSYQIRLEGYLVTIDTLSFPKDTQTLISFDIENLPSYIHVEKMQLFSLSEQEKTMLQSHIQYIRFPKFLSDSTIFAYQKLYVKQGNFTTLVKNNKEYIFPLRSQTNNGKFILKTEEGITIDTLIFNPKLKYNLEILSNPILEPLAKNNYFYYNWISNDNTVQELQRFLPNYPQPTFKKKENPSKKPCECENEQIKIFQTDLSKKWITLVLIENNENLDSTNSEIKEARKYIFLTEQDKIGDLPIGKYSAEIRFEDTTFKKIDSIFIKPNQLSYLNLDYGQTIEKPISFYPLLKDSVGFMSNSLVCLAGMIVDKDFFGLRDVKITSQKTNFSTYTDKKGFFKFYGFIDDTLLISYPSYDDKKIIISPSGQYHDLFIMLGGEIESLSEVNITSTAAREEKQSLAYSVQNVSSSQTYGSTNALAGKMAGVQINSSSGEAGAATRIVIRGVASISTDSDDLEEVIVTGYAKTDTQILNKLYQNNTTDLDKIKTILQKEGISLNEQTSLEMIEKAIQNCQKKQTSLSTLSTFGTKKTLRNNFKDNAIWQPTLRTDRNGKVSFEVTYPDNITSWQTNLVAINTKRQVGQLQTKTLSYLPLSAQVAVPRFLVRGDSIKIIGKVASYLSDSVVVKTAFQINDKAINLQNSSKKQILFSSLDSIWINTSFKNELKKDSLKVRYSLENNQNATIYKDGEERFVPIFEKGVFVNNGFFAVLEGDTLLNLQAFRDSLTSKNTIDKNSQTDFVIAIQNNILEAMLGELKNIQNYAYMCNEQKASKIRAYVLEKEILQLLGQKFSNKKQLELNDLIEKLQKAQTPYYTWGWWDGSKPDAKMTNYIATVLAESYQKGENIDVQVLKNTYSMLVKNSSSMDSTQQIAVFTTLFKIDEALNFKNYSTNTSNNKNEKQQKQQDELKQKVSLLTDSLLSKMVKEKTILEKIEAAKNQQSINQEPKKALSFYNRLSLIRLRQLYDLDYSLDILQENKYKTSFGGIFWNDKMNFSSYSIFENEIQTTLLAYQILQNHLKGNNLSEKEKNSYSNELSKIRQYFLEKKSRSFYWRNTHESATILSTILPDFISKENNLTEKSEKKTEQKNLSANLKFDDKNIELIKNSDFIQHYSNENFPQKIQKTGISPLFVSVSEKHFEPNPKSNQSKNFRIQTFLETDKKQLNSDSIFIQAGKQIKLIVEVEVLQTASYVQITVPIPASCVYAPSETSFRNYYQIETYREHFKEKTVIFCSEMPIGKYRFEVILEPRYQGYFTLNPAKVQMMYFPIFFENTISKKVIVEECEERIFLLKTEF